MDTVNVFVYGTLKPGGAYHQQYCVPYLRECRPAQTQGCLYDLPELGYPVMTMGNDWVNGYLLALDQAAMTGLDYLEGYTPDQPCNLPGDNEFRENYIRQWVKVFDLNHRPMGDAWVYVMTNVPEGAIWLSEGEWKTMGS